MKVLLLDGRAEPYDFAIILASIDGQVKVVQYLLKFGRNYNIYNSWCGA
jgi:hypothetical protein